MTIRDLEKRVERLEGEKGRKAEKGSLCELLPILAGNGGEKDELVGIEDGLVLFRYNGKLLEFPLEPIRGFIE